MRIRPSERPFITLKNPTGHKYQNFENIFKGLLLHLIREYKKKFFTEIKEVNFGEREADWSKTYFQKYFAFGPTREIPPPKMCQIEVNKPKSEKNGILHHFTSKHN